MTEDEARLFFVQHCAAHLREMKLRDARAFLRGLLAFSIEDAFPELRKVYIGICDCDAQLELLAPQQRLLPLDGKKS